MELRLGKTRICLHPLMLMFPAIAYLMGAQSEIAALMFSLSLHEFAHWLAAQAVHVPIEEIRLMPFGGAAHIGNPYVLSGSQLFITATAGPLSNLALIIICAAFAHWGLLAPDFALTMLEVNLMLMLFNLLPALPLDGGRMLYAVLFPSLGSDSALNIGILLGRILAFSILILGLYTWISSGILNLSMFFAPVFILASAPEERQALGRRHIQTTLNELKPLSSPLPANLYAVNEECSIRSALRAASPNAVSLYAVYSENKLKTITDDRHLLKAALRHSADMQLCDVEMIFGQNKSPD